MWQSPSRNTQIVNIHLKTIVRVVIAVMSAAWWVSAPITQATEILQKAPDITGSLERQQYFRDSPNPKVYVKF